MNPQKVIEPQMKLLLSKFGLHRFDIYGDWIQQWKLWRTNLISYNHELQCYDYIESSTYETHKYFFVSIIKTGGYNDIKLCRYLSNPVIIRTTKSESCKFSSFVENLKTIYLYCWYKCNYPDIKMFPDIYSFSYNITTRKYYLVMEYIPDTLNNHIISNKNKYQGIADMIYKIIKLMHTLRIIKFRHGDLTSSNILVQNNEPIFIDFGFSSFNILDKWFDSESNIINYFNKYPTLDPSLNSIYNQMHDLTIFMHSLCFIQVWLPNIKLPDMILSGRSFHYFIRIFSNKLTGINKDLSYEDKLAINSLLYFDEPGSLDLHKSSYIYASISPLLYHKLMEYK